METGVGDTRHSLITVGSRCGELPTFGRIRQMGGWFLHCPCGRSVGKKVARDQKYHQRWPKWSPSGGPLILNHHCVEDSHGTKVARVASPASYATTYVHVPPRIRNPSGPVLVTGHQAPSRPRITLEQ